MVKEYKWRKEVLRNEQKSKLKGCLWRIYQIRIRMELVSEEKMRRMKKLFLMGTAIAVLTAAILGGCGRGGIEKSEASSGSGPAETEAEQRPGEASALPEGTDGAISEEEEKGTAGVVPEKAADDAASEEAAEQADDASEDFIEKQTAWYLDSMTLEQKVAQLFVVTPEALTGMGTVTAAGNMTRDALEQYPVGGLVYLKQNLVSVDQTTEMLSNTQMYYEEMTGLPIFLSVDEEGGSVARVANSAAFGVENVGSMKSIGETGDTELAYQAGVTIGTYLGELGFNLDFAPVADVLTNPGNTVVSDRSFGSDCTLVTDMVLREMEGFAATGVLSCVKHFPGHGCTKGDTHEGYAYTDKTLEELLENELVPFQAAVSQGAEFIMVSHISVPKVVGDNTPSSLSEIIVTELLRDEMGFDGIVITDALNMGAVSENYSSARAAVKSLQAGVDMILMPADFQAAYQGVLEAVEEGNLSEERIDESVARILRVKLSMK